MPSDYDLIRSGSSAMFAAFSAKISDSLQSKMSGKDLTVHLGVFAALFSLDVVSLPASIEALQAFTRLERLDLISALSVLSAIGAINTVTANRNEYRPHVEKYELVADLAVLSEFLDAHTQGQSASI